MEKRLLLICEQQYYFCEKFGDLSTFVPNLPLFIFFIFLSFIFLTTNNENDLKVLTNGKKEGGPKLVHINRSIMKNCLVGKCPFAILMRQCHKRNIKWFPAS
jgi:hypothetical protein